MAFPGTRWIAEKLFFVVKGISPEIGFPINKKTTQFFLHDSSIGSSSIERVSSSLVPEEMLVLIVYLLARRSKERFSDEAGFQMRCSERLASRSSEGSKSREDRMTSEGLLEGGKQRKTLLSQGRKIAAKAAEVFRSLVGAKLPEDLLLNL